MWETIKNDPILKAVTIIILSVLGFGFAFNIMFGPNNSGMEGMSGPGGYSLGNTLSYIFILAFKLLLIALVVAAFIAVFKLAGKHLLKGGESKMFDSIKKDPVLKGITVAGLIIVAFGLIYYLFSSLFGLGNGYGLGLSGLLVILLKLLLAAAVIGLIIGLVMYVKQSYGKEIADKILSVKITPKPSVKCPECNAAVSDDFKFCPKCGGRIKEQCSSCGGELKNEWKCCPVCGNERDAVEKGLSQDECPL